MSDVWDTVSYATVWDGSNVTEVCIGCGDFGTYGTAEIDATPEAVTAAADWHHARAVARRRAETEASIDRIVNHAACVLTGKDVTVVRGRKVPKGTTGRIF